MGLGLGVDGHVLHHVAVRENSVHILIDPVLPGDDVPLRDVAVVKMDKALPRSIERDTVINGRLIVEVGRAEPVAHIHQAGACFGGLLRLRDYHGHRLAHEPHGAFQDHPVMGGPLRGRLRCQSDGMVLGNVLIGQYAHHAVDRQGTGRVNFLNVGKGMGTLHDFQPQGVPGDEILHIQRFAQAGGHAVHLSNGLLDHGIRLLSFMPASGPLFISAEPP